MHGHLTDKELPFPDFVPGIQGKETSAIPQASVIAGQARPLAGDTKPWRAGLTFSKDGEGNHQNEDELPARMDDSFLPTRTDFSFSRRVPVKRAWSDEYSYAKKCGVFLGHVKSEGLGANLHRPTYPHLS